MHASRKAWVMSVFLLLTACKTSRSVLNETEDDESSELVKQKDDFAFPYLIIFRFKAVQPISADTEEMRIVDSERRDTFIGNTIVIRPRGPGLDVKLNGRSSSSFDNGFTTLTVQAKAHVDNEGQINFGFFNAIRKRTLFNSGLFYHVEHEPKFNDLMDRSLLMIKYSDDMEKFAKEKNRSDRLTKVNYLRTAFRNFSDNWDLDESQGLRIEVRFKFQESVINELIGNCEISERNSQSIWSELLKLKVRTKDEFESVWNKFSQNEKSIEKLLSQKATVTEVQELREKTSQMACEYGERLRSLEDQVTSLKTTVADQELTCQVRSSIMEKVFNLDLEGLRALRTFQLENYRKFCTVQREKVSQIGEISPRDLVKTILQELTLASLPEVIDTNLAIEQYRSRTKK